MQFKARAARCWDAECSSQYASLAGPLSLLEVRAASLMAAAKQMLNTVFAFAFFDKSENSICISVG